DSNRRNPRISRRHGTSYWRALTQPNHDLDFIGAERTVRNKFVNLRNITWRTVVHGLYCYRRRRFWSVRYQTEEQ
ncbi:MAG: hypothetical protein WBL91_12310, partial [Pseudolabrys sp.]